MSDRYDPQRLLAYVEDELPAAKRAELERDLAEDPQLEALVRQLAEDRRRLRDLPVEPVPPKLLEEPMQQIERQMLLADASGHGARPRGVDRSRGLRLLRKVAVAAVILLIGAGAAIVLDGLFDMNPFQIASEWTTKPKPPSQVAHATTPQQHLALNAPTTQKQQAAAVEAKALAASKPTAAGPAAQAAGMQRESQSLAANARVLGGRLNAADASKTNLALRMATAGNRPTRATEVIRIQTADPNAASQQVRNWAMAHDATVQTVATHGNNTTSSALLARDGLQMAAKQAPGTAAGSMKLDVTMRPGEMDALTRALRAPKGQAVTVAMAAGVAERKRTVSSLDHFALRGQAQAQADEQIAQPPKADTQPARGARESQSFNWLGPLDAQLPLAKTVDVPAGRVTVSIIIEPMRPVQQAKTQVTAATQPSAAGEPAANAGADSSVGGETVSPTPSPATSPSTEPSPALP